MKLNDILFAGALGLSTGCVQAPNKCELVPPEGERLMVALWDIRDACREGTGMIRCLFEDREGGDLNYQLVDGSCHSSILLGQIVDGIHDGTLNACSEISADVVCENK